MDKSSPRHPPTSIDLFAGAGGMTEGLRKAGFRTLVANEYDPMAAKTFKFNHSEVEVLNEDIKAISVQRFLKAAKTGKGKVSLISGGPPCQGFSLAGQRLADDPRNQMFKEFVRIVNGVRPDVFIFENVSGITSMQGGKALEVIVEEFTSIGYKCEWKILNAADYGVPQSRPRFIMIGNKYGMTIGFPEPTHVSDKSKEDDLFAGRLPKHVTTWEALSDLPEIEQGEGEQQMLHASKPANAYQAQRRGNRKPGVLFNHEATRHGPSIISRYAAIPEGGNGAKIPVHLRTKKINVFKLDRSRPARTITCNHRTDILHPTIPRGTTVREAARLQSFDDDYQFFGNLTRKAKWVTQDDQVGNAVPPLLAQAIGMHIKKALKW